MSATATTYKVGDLVTPIPAYWPAHFLGVVYKVTKVPAGARGVNYVVERADGVHGRGLRGPAYAFQPHDGDAPAKSSYEVILEEIAKTPDVGTVVTVQGISKINPEALYVVTAESRKPGCVRLSKLGGEGSRYWPSIPVAMITVVPLHEIASHL